MWVVEGAFEAEPGNLETKKIKLLKPGRSYPLGRKAKHPLQLILSHPKISAEHVTFVVGEQPIANVDDPKTRPTLTLQNQRNKALQISRSVNGQNERVLLQPLAEDTLHSGDVIALVTGIYVSVRWMPVCCYTSPKAPVVPLAKCAALGLKVVSTLHPEVTHHLTSTLSATTPLTISLLNPASFVLPDWLTELLHLGETAASPDAPSSLEQDFRLPSDSDYRPPFDPALPASLRSYLRWEPSQQRVGLLKGWRFFFIGEKGRELDSESRMLLERGGGEYETFDIASGVVRWKQSLARNQRKAYNGGGKGLCLIGDTEVLKMIASDLWNEIKGILQAQNLRVFKQTDLLEAIFMANLDLIKSSPESGEQEESPLPSIVPNTHEIQPISQGSPENAPPSQEPATSRSKLRKRATAPSRGTTPAADEQPTSSFPVAADAPVPSVSALEPEVQPSHASEEPAVATRRKPLIRRARTNAPPTPLSDLDDPTAPESQIPDSEKQNQPASAKPPSFGKPVSQSSIAAGRSGLLKKRARDGAPRNPILAGLEKESERLANGEEPPLKKYRDLFEETDPDRVASQFPQSGVSSGGIADSQFSQVPMESQSAAVTNGLSAVPEEEEESMPTSTITAEAPQTAPTLNSEDESPLSPRKKPAKPPSAGDGAALSPSQRPPVSSTQMSAMSKTASSKTGAAPGKPDTDAAFLKALASTKKGKRREDDFDREFNNLRISVPEREKDQQAEEWKVLADFGDESNILGNFMVIMEMDVPEHGRDRSNASVGGSRAQSKELDSPAWHGKPDFKKFKKKTNARPRPPVELVVDDENDYGMGAGYWKSDSQSQSQSQPQAGPSQTNGITNGETQQRGYLQPSQSQNRGFLQTHAPASKGKKSQTQPQSLFQTQLRMQENAAAKSKAKSKTPEPTAPTLRGRSQGHGRAKGKAKQVLSDVDEDEDAIEMADVENDVEPSGTTDQLLFLNESAEVDLNLDLKGISDDDVDDEAGRDPPAFRSQSQRSTRSKPNSVTERTAATRKTANARKRAAELMDDDSDTGMAFTGFGGSGRTQAAKKARAR